MSNGRVIAIVGESGGGKGTLIKEKLRKTTKPVHILSTANDFDVDQIYYILTEFIEACCEMEDVILVMGEAQVFLPPKWETVQRKYPKLLKMYANARKFNVLFIHEFHAYQQVPVWLPTYLNGSERFFTRDNYKVQARRFEMFPTLVKSFIDKPVMPLHEHIYIHIR